MSLFSRNAEWTWPEGVAVGAIYFFIWPFFGGFIAKAITTDVDGNFCRWLKRHYLLNIFCFSTQAISFGLWGMLLDSGAGR